MSMYKLLHAWKFSVKNQSNHPIMKYPGVETSRSEISNTFRKKSKYMQVIVIQTI